MASGKKMLPSKKDVRAFRDVSRLSIKSAAFLLWHLAGTRQLLPDFAAI
ncbi:hypothetical protein [Brevibacillus agri]|nr:hypothetical protein [Brevibacillus agri]MCG5251774.1 hypothetical protein [Brevibacillus agri]